MWKSLIFIAAVVATIAIYPSCKKSSDNNTASKDTTFAQQLAASCSHQFLVVVDTSCYALPTAFSPNGDGINDVVSLMGIHSTISSFQMTIYKTDGTQVFQTDLYSNSWDGKDTFGHKCTDYKYYVKIQLTSTDANIDMGSYIYMLRSNKTAGCDSTVAADKPNYRFSDEFDPLTGTFHYTTNEVFCN